MYIYTHAHTHMHTYTHKCSFLAFVYYGSRNNDDSTFLMQLTLSQGTELVDRIHLKVDDDTGRYTEREFGHLQGNDTVFRTTMLWTP